MIFNIIEYFIRLFSGDTAYLSKMKELNVIFKNFKSGKTRYITKDRVMTQQFLAKMTEFHRQTLSIGNFLSSTIFSTDDKRSMAFISSYIDSFLPPNIIEAREHTVRDYVIKMVVENEYPNKVIQLIEKDFNDYKNYLSDSRLGVIELEYNLLYAIYHLCSFNFAVVLSKFDHTYRAEGKSSPTYSEVKGSEIKEELKDLYYILSSLPRKVSLNNIFNKLIERAGADSGSGYDAKKMVSQVDDIYKTISNELSPVILLNLLKYIEENPGLRIKVNFAEKSVIDDFKKYITDIFGKTREMALNLASEKSYKKDIKDLFGDIGLLPVDGYNDEINDILNRKGFSIDFILPLKIVKTFLNFKYDKNVRENINSLLLEGLFADKSMQSSFSDMIFALNEHVDKFGEFEKKISGDESNSFKTLRAGLSSVRVNESKVKMNVDLVDEKIKLYIDKLVEYNYKFCRILYEILSDYKSGNKDRISNLREIKSGLNKDFITVLMNYYQDCVKLLKLLKKFQQ